MAMTGFAQGVIDVHSHIITSEFVSALDKEGRLLDEGFPLPKWDAEAQLKWMDSDIGADDGSTSAKLKREYPGRL